jgi:hypothetical protein
VRGRALFHVASSLPNLLRWIASARQAQAEGGVLLASRCVSREKPKLTLPTCMVGAGDGKRGKKQFQAPLADPYAEPNEALVPLVEETLRAVAAALLADATEAEAAAAAAAAAVPEAQHAGVAKSLAYLRDRVGVPRDMSYPAAMYFRAYLNLFRDHMV